MCKTVDLNFNCVFFVVVAFVSNVFFFALAAFRGVLLLAKSALECALTLHVFRLL